MGSLKSGKTGVPSRAYPLLGRIKGLREVISIHSSLKRFYKDEVAAQRLKVIKFYAQHGEKLTKEAFAVGRKTIWVWKKKLTSARGSLSSLVPESTRPKVPRKMQTEARIVDFIKATREEHPRLGKDKLYPLLASYCAKEGIRTIKPSTIGKVIKRNKLFYQKASRIYHNPASGFSLNRKKKKRLRVRYAPRHKEFGHLQMDTLVLLVDGVRCHMYSAIDIHGKVCLSLPYPSLNAKNTLDFLKKLELILPYPILSVQTDNGLEFLGVFDAYLEKRGIPHLFTYPRCPRINGCIERYQRSLREEFLDYNLHLIHQPKLFSRKLAEYLVFFLTERIHSSLGGIPPMEYLLKKGGMSKKTVTYTAT